MGRIIVRSEHAAAIQANNERLLKQKEAYRKRQAIVEHPFGPSSEFGQRRLGLHLYADEGSEES
ncbi:transposase IS4 family protein [Flammeovirgaceae bacterium 311]|nr:transposase IS4 family protein [Flammeovirgaceae bacterium 311]